MNDHCLILLEEPQPEMQMLGWEIAIHKEKPIVSISRAASNGLIFKQTSFAGAMMNEFTN